MYITHLNTCSTPHVSTAPRAARRPKISGSSQVKTHLQSGSTHPYKCTNNLREIRVRGGEGALKSTQTSTKLLRATMTRTAIPQKICRLCHTLAFGCDATRLFLRVSDCLLYPTLPMNSQR